VAQIWQEIEVVRRSCHWWQERIERRITAMTQILLTVLALGVLATGLLALIHFARTDTFAGPGTGYRPCDELGPLVNRRRPA
jgi:hypothetical protein